jgi:hypothetical protein
MTIPPPNQTLDRMTRSVVSRVFQFGRHCLRRTVFTVVAVMARLVRIAQKCRAE